jgi:hypothetical protein
VTAKFANGVTKRIVKALARRFLPESVIRLPKIGFRMPAAMWAQAAEFLRDGRVAGLLKWPARDQTEVLDLLEKRPYYQFRLLACEIWLRTRFDGEPAAGIAERLIGCRGALA